MSRLIFIGDVHGCARELESLLALLGPTPGEDRIIFVGDLVDKGPDSLKVLRDVQRLMRTLPGSAVVAGNHEEKALRFMKSGKLDALKDQTWVHDATAEDWAFIESMPLTWHEDGIRVVHGGIFPALLEKHPDAFERIDARGANWHKGGGKCMNRARRMLRVRYVGEESGDMLALFENKDSDPFWADVYDGSQGHVIYGHSPFLDGKVKTTAHATGIDTACVFGSKLTALVVQKAPMLPGPEHLTGRNLPGGRIATTVSVDARERYAQPLDED